ncbi:MAG: FAD-dependent oxidoreductase [Gammaproteobacteria bacterium]|nr:FAD-dependent oxidoreductase [Gammaproteobacteria bacterium]
MSDNTKIIVVGAGIAGLAAAKELNAQGFDVTILEARNRIGGRTWSDYSMGIPFDIGAFIIHGMTNNPIAELAKQYKCQTKTIGMDSVFFAHQITQYDSNELNKLDNQFHQLLTAASEFANSQPTDITLDQALNVAIKHTPIFNSKIFNWYKLVLSLYTGADVNNLSARHWDDEVSLEGGHHLMVSGYGPIINGLAGFSKIELATKVVAIDYSKKAVQVQTTKGKLEADAVIITIPLGALKKDTIQFMPALPDRKIASLHRLGMGVLNKILLQFPHRFWPENDRIFSYLADDYKTPAFFHNFSLYYGKPMIMCGLAGEMAIEFEKMTDASIIRTVMHTLQQMFGSSVPQPQQSFITRWANDCYSYGSYSHALVGGSSNDYLVLSEPLENKIFFAGEATHPEYPATTHGAYLSGIREATRIIGNAKLESSVNEYCSHNVAG